MISKRLKSLVKYINKNDKIIDIGCDHALLDIYLIKNKYVNTIIVSDISSNALKQGIKNIKKYNLDNYIETRLGNGLNVLNNNDYIDTIIISGMGTYTILDILNNKYLENINKLIIQSNKDYDILREKVCNLGFIIDKEEVILDNDKIYINIVFIRGKSNLSKEEIIYGTKDMINKEIYYRYLLDKYKKIYLLSKDNKLKEKIKYINKMLNN